VKEEKSIANYERSRNTAKKKKEKKIHGKTEATEKSNNWSKPHPWILETGKRS
jgi:hypothetical protein